MRGIYARVLGEAGYEMSMAKDGAEALTILETEEPDLVLMDIEMPKLSGWEVLAIMRNRVEWQDVPVIMATGLLEPSATELASRPRHECYVTKKITGKELLELVERVLAAGSAARAAREPEAWEAERPVATEKETESLAPPEAAEEDMPEGQSSVAAAPDSEETDMERGWRLEANKRHSNEG
jgi:CheY-like chemotaxis protein